MSSRTGHTTLRSLRSLSFWLERLHSAENGPFGLDTGRNGNGGDDREGAKDAPGGSADAGSARSGKNDADNDSGSLADIVQAVLSRFDTLDARMAVLEGNG